MFLLQAVMQSQASQNTTAIIFNVKGDDLLFIDQDAKNLETVKSDWEKCGLQAKPFDNVRYYFPYSRSEAKGYANTWCDAETVKEVCGKRGGNYIYTYKHDKEKIDLLLSNIDDPNMTIESIQNAILTENVFNNQITDWQGLLAEVERRSQGGSEGGNKSITVQSWRRFQRLLNTMFKNSADSIFQDTLSDRQEKHHVHLSDEVGNIKGGETVVIDIAQLPEQQKCLVFGDVIRTVYQMKVDGSDNCPDKIVIFVDELNKYAPESVNGSPIINSLIEITERGRSLGIVLFAAEQFRSAIHKRVKGNCATNVYGRTNGTEIATSDYRYLPKNINSIMTRLPKGDLIVQHPIFRGLLKIQFPRPAYLQPEH